MTPLFGPYGGRALDHGAQLAAHGVNAVWFHGFDPPAFEGCARLGLAPCVELKTFRADFAQHPELIPIGVDGKPIRYGRLVQGVCLSQTEFLDRIEEELLAGVRTYHPTGIWLDYLTYGGWFETPEPDLQESCFCPACIAEFGESCGVDATTSSEILGRYAHEWERHKGERVADFALRYAEIIRRHLPECVVGAYMCPWSPGEFEGALSRIFAQDYQLLAPAIDVFTPLLYTEKCGRSPEWAREWLERSPRFVPAGKKVQLILDALDFPASLEAAAASAVPSWGVQVFGGAEIFADPDRAETFARLVRSMEGRS